MDELMQFVSDMGAVWSRYGGSILRGAWTTILLAVICTVLGCVIGFAVGTVQANPVSPRYGLVRRVLTRVGHGLLRAYVEFFRGTPLMLQIMIVFYGPGLMFGLPLLPRFTAAVVTFVINYACYFSEIFRGGIQGVPVGQREAGLVLGMTRSQIFFKVTLLQVIKRIVPPLGNEFITLVKDTALVRVISVYEIIWMGESYIKKGMIWPLFYTAVFYLAISGILTLLLGWCEKKMDYFK